MLDWVRTAEEKISVSRDALAIEHGGKMHARAHARTQTPKKLIYQRAVEYLSKQQFAQFQMAAKRL